LEDHRGLRTPDYTIPFELYRPALTMCGRYSLALVSHPRLYCTARPDLLQRPSEVRAYLEAEGMEIDEALADDGDHAPRQSYNFAPGYHGIVYRADVPDWGAGPRPHKKGEKEEHNEETAVEEEMEMEASAQNKAVKYKMQSMKWGIENFTAVFYGEYC